METDDIFPPATGDSQSDSDDEPLSKVNSFFMLLQLSLFSSKLFVNCKKELLFFGVLKIFEKVVIHLYSVPYKDSVKRF